MSKSNQWETALLDLVFRNQAVTGIGDAGGLLPSAASGSLYVSLHTADPGEAGDQETSEAAYASYARLAVARDGTEWTVSGDTASNTNNLAFPTCTGGLETITHFGIGTDASGPGTLLYSGEFSAALAVSTGLTPQVAAGDLTITEA